MRLRFMNANFALPRKMNTPSDVELCTNYLLQHSLQLQATVTFPGIKPKVVI